MWVDPVSFGGDKRTLNSCSPFPRPRRTEELPDGRRFLSLAPESGCVSMVGRDKSGRLVECRDAWMSDLKWYVHGIWVIRIPVYVYLRRRC